MVQGMDGFRQIGNTLRQTWRLGTLADLYLQAQRPEEAEAALQEAFSISETSHEHRWDAELYRLRGKLALARGEFATQAEHDYVQALELARTQQAKTLELRAAIDLAQLWARQRKASEARTLLSDILNWFTEGFDTPDLRAASALLNELPSS